MDTYEHIIESIENLPVDQRNTLKEDTNKLDTFILMNFPEYYSMIICSLRFNMLDKDLLKVMAKEIVV